MKKTSTSDKIFGTLGNIMGKFSSSDPLSVESELSPSDLGTVIPENTDTEQAIVGLVESRMRDAASNRQSKEPGWFLGLAYYNGNQEVEWKNNSLRPLSGMSDPHRIFTQRNKIRPKIKTLLAKAISSRPIANVSPATDSDIDRAAAAEARAIIDHQDSLHSRQHQIKRMARYALTTSTVFLKIVWDASAEADVPKMKDGAVVGVTRAKVGEIAEYIVPCFELYIDPKAHTFDEARWLIHAKTRTIDYIQTHYPRGKFVEGEINSGPDGYVQSRLAAIVMDYQRGNEPGKKNSVLVKEMWELPTARFPKGRLITVANGIVLRNTSWPSDNTEVFPFVPLSYEEGQDTVYGLNAITDLIPSQRSYNETLSRLKEREKTAWGKILAPIGAEIGEGAFNSAEENEIIYYNQGLRPDIIPAPPVPPVFQQLLEIEEANMDDISGIHNVSEGQIPTGVTSGNAIELLQQNDTTQLSDFTEGIEHAIQTIARIEIGLASQYYSEPRLLAVSNASASKSLPFMQKSKPEPQQPAEQAPGAPNQPPQDTQGGQGDPEQPQAPEAPPEPPVAPPNDSDALSPGLQVQYFRALTAGGSCRINVATGSATPKSPAAQNENVLNMFKAGLLGPPGAPETAAIALKLLDYTRSDEVIEWVMAAKDKLVKEAQTAMAQQPPPPNPVQLTAMNHANQVASQQSAQQAASEQAQTNLNNQVEVERTKAQSAAALFEQRAQLDKEMAQMKYDNELQKQAALFEHQKTHIPVSLSGKLDEQGTRSAEFIAGVEPGYGAAPQDNTGAGYQDTTGGGYQDNSGGEYPDNTGAPAYPPLD